ncbi:MAG: hypothetical protein O2783_02990 [Chloroflexi bacterium]|nr:hypothetical protein [Chloroflexota bacterium]
MTEAAVGVAAGVRVGGSGAVGEDAGVVLAEGETVGTSTPVGDGVGFGVEGAVGADTWVGDGCGAGVQRTTRYSTANINSITENLRITVGICQRISSQNTWS